MGRGEERRTTLSSQPGNRTLTRTDILDLGAWCILRMSSADTLALVESLTRADLEVWTPTDRFIARKPKTRAQFTKTAPLMPSYAFANVQHIAELLHLAMLPNSKHPRFTLFRSNGGFPLVADTGLNPLREEEARKHGIFERLMRRGKRGPKLAIGTNVRLPDGPFAGFTGTVREVQGQFTLVDTAIFGKTVDIKIASILLESCVITNSLCALAA